MRTKIPHILASTLYLVLIFAGAASAEPESAAYDRVAARATIEAYGYNAAHQDRAGVNVYAAAALAQCADRRLSIIEEMRLGILLIGEVEPRTSLSEVSTALKFAFSKSDADCGSTQVQAAIQAFSIDVLPRLQAPILR